MSHSFQKPGMLGPASYDHGNGKWMCGSVLNPLALLESLAPLKSSPKPSPASPNLSDPPKCALKQLKHCTFPLISEENPLTNSYPLVKIRNYNINIQHEILATHVHPLNAKTAPSHPFIQRKIKQTSFSACPTTLQIPNPIQRWRSNKYRFDSTGKVSLPNAIHLLSHQRLLLLCRCGCGMKSLR